MALILADRVKETTTVTGTQSTSPTATLLGAAIGFQTFAVAMATGSTTYYCIAGQGTSEWEVGLGTLSASTTLTRAVTPLSSSNTGQSVNFSAGIKDVFVSYPASKSVSLASTGLVATSALGTGTADSNAFLRGDGTWSANASLVTQFLTYGSIPPGFIGIAQVGLDTYVCDGVSKMKQGSNVVEFIRGTGIITNGVVDATSLNGPWSWTPPSAVVAMMDIIGGGAGGSFGGVGATGGSGGGGGGAGMHLRAQVALTPNNALTITVGAAGTGGAYPTTYSTGGGNSVVALPTTGLVTPWDPIFLAQGISPPQLTSWGGGQGTSGSGGSNGLTGTVVAGGYGQQSGSYATGGSGGANTGTAGSPSGVQPNNNQYALFTAGFTWFVFGGAGGGGVGSTTAGNGGYYPQEYGRTPSSVALGMASGTFAGGGVGGGSFYGRAGAGGNGNATAASVGGNGTGYGTAGGGGGGSNTSSTGGNGTNGYIRITF